jgi:monoamine oxidase
MVAPILNFSVPTVLNDPDDWYPNYPNAADFQFDYFKLLSLASKSGIGKAPQPGIKVAVIGAGVAGMVAARELYRAGYVVTVYEASNRLGGRHYTLEGSTQETGMELGGMRFPFFAEPGAHNSVFEYYLGAEATPILSPFPNPGSAPDNTGIYINQGYGPEDEFYPEKKMIIWPPGQPIPDDPYLKPVAELVNAFVKFFTNTVSALYGKASWPKDWEKIADRYDKMSFSDLVFAPVVTEYRDDGWLGGFGMNEAQSQLFYTIGAGDGSWGTFYAIGALWFIRCVMFGFNSDLQTVVGLEGAEKLPYYRNSNVNDSARTPLPPPRYAGIQSLVEWLLYQPPPNNPQSLYGAVHNDVAFLYVNRPVRSITYNDSYLDVRDGNGDSGTAFKYVIVTPETWATQLGIDFLRFPTDALPSPAFAAIAEQHVISSCKVFFPLKEAYWTNPNCPIPQVIVTDTLVQDAYGIQWFPNTNDPGTLLASYTWEDDATKFIPYSDREVARMILNKLDEITTSTLGEDQKISDYVADLNDAVVFQWAKQLGYSGCAKLYRQRGWTQNYALLAYNQEHASKSRLYLAGETFSVEGGWTEPALRLAIDAVIRLIQHTGGTFVEGFDVEKDYPRFDVEHTPGENYNPDPAVVADDEKP